MSEKRARKLRKRKARMKHAVEVARRRKAKPKLLDMYIDESGNSGLRLFGTGQNTFIANAMLVKAGTDVSQPVSELRYALGDADLHGTDLGLSRLNEVAEPLLAAFKACSPRFLISIVDKQYFCAMKLWDCLFDAATNPGVNGLHVSAMPLRFTLMAKFCYFRDESLLQEFWEIYGSSGSHDYTELLAKLRLFFKTSKLDRRSKELIDDAIAGASTAQVEVFGYGAHDHDSPNIAAVLMLIDAINHRFARRTAPHRIQSVVHDRQDQFGDTITMFFNLTKDSRTEWSMEQLYPRHNKSDIFEGMLVMAEDDSDLLDLCDIACFLFKKALSSPIRGALERVYNYIGQRGVPLLMNERGYNDKAMELYGDCMALNHTDSALNHARKLVDTLDLRRKERLKTGKVEWS